MHQAEAAGQPTEDELQSALGHHFRFSKQFRQTLDLCISFSNEIDPLIGGGLVQLLPHALHVATETLYRLELQMGGRLKRASGNPGGRDGWKLVDLSQRRVGGKELFGVLQPLMVVAPFLFQLVRLD